MLRDLVVKNRTCRRFHQHRAVARETLEGLVDLARLSASGGNLQPLKFYLSCDPAANATIFSHLQWAAYLKDWPGPPEGERPAAYIVILGDTQVTASFGCDHGIAAQSIMLGATELGLRGCMIGSVNRDGLRTALNLADGYEILLVLALGEPKETAMLERAAGRGADIKYWRDADGLHHVPKRDLKDMLLD